jgi:tetratricopeptide (TPR) repeat protein
VEPSNPSARGQSLSARLLRWSLRPGTGFARIEFNDERIRRQVTTRLYAAMQVEGRVLHPFRLEPAASAGDLVQALLKGLGALSPGACSLTGFSTALPSDPTQLATYLTALNFHREALARMPLRQIWWLSPYLVDALIRTSPDLDSWFDLRLQLEESVPLIVSRSGLIDGERLDSPDLVEAARRGEELLRRFNEAMSRGLDPQEAARLLGLPALIALREAKADALARPLAARLQELAPRLFEVASTATGANQRVAEMIGRADTLREAGFIPEAAGLLKAAVDEARAAVESGLPAAETGLAHALTNLAVALRDVGHPQEALEAGTEAVAMNRQLAVLDPAGSLPRLALALNNLAGFLSDLARHRETLQIASESVHVLRKLAALNPEAFEGQLAAALVNLSNHLAALHRYEEALPPAREAIEIFRRLNARSGGCQQASLAWALRHLAMCLGCVHQGPDALVMAEESTQLYRTAVTTDPAEHLKKLAESLWVLGTRRRASGRLPEALAAAEESVQLYRKLAAFHGPAAAPELAESLMDLAMILSVLDRHADAIEIAQEAVALRRKTILHHQGVPARELAESLLTLEDCLQRAGRLPAAREAAEEAISLYRKTAPELPADRGMGQVVAFGKLATLLEGLKEPERALGQYLEAIQLLADEFHRSPSFYSQLMRPLASSYLRLCQTLKREPDRALMDPIIRRLSETES